MVTKNFKALMATILQAAGNNGGVALLEIKDATGAKKYIGNSHYYTFPGTVTKTFAATSSTSTPGIIVGKGTTEPTENDYDLESRITSGLTFASPSISSNTDANGNPYLEYICTVTNTTGEDITISEIGYFQNIYGNDTKGGTANNTIRVMLDRTVLSTPVTVPANGTAAVKYTLKTIMS